MKQKLIALGLLLTGVVASASTPPVVFATYWDAPSLARLSMLLPQAASAAQNIQVLVASTDADPGAYEIRVDYIDASGAKQSQQKIVPTQGGTAMASFFNVDNIIFVSTTVTPYLKGAASVTVPHTP